MEDLQKNYDEDKMTWNNHDRTYFEERVDTIYNKIAEVLIAQNERFFQEQEKHHRRICVCEDKLGDHEKKIDGLDGRIRRLELKALKKVLIWCGGIGLGLMLLSFIIF